MNRRTLTRLLPFLPAAGASTVTSAPRLGGFTVRIVGPSERDLLWAQLIRRAEILAAREPARGLTGSAPWVLPFPD